MLPALYGILLFPNHFFLPDPRRWAGALLLSVLWHVSVTSCHQFRAVRQMVSPWSVGLSSPSMLRQKSLADCQLDSWWSWWLAGHWWWTTHPAPLSRPGMRLGMSRNSAAATSPKIRIHRRRRRPGRPIRALGWSAGRPMGGRGWSRVRAVCHPDSGRPAPVLSLVPPPTSCSCLASGQLAVMCLATTTTTTPPSKPTVLLILFALHSWIYQIFYEPALPSRPCLLVWFNN